MCWCSIKLTLIYSIIYLFQFQCTNSRKIIRLESLNIKPEEITVSGFDSGGAAASSFMISNSKIVSGLSLFSSYPYLCAGTGKTNWEKINNCQEPFYDAEYVRDFMDMYQHQGKIDDLDNLMDVPVYVEHGRDDPLIPTETGRGYVNFLRNLTHDVKFMSPFEGHHPLMMRMRGDDSSQSMSATGFDSVFQGLKYIYRNKKKIVKPQKMKSSECLTLSSGGLQSFVQDEFAEKNASLAKFGNIYIPPNCQGGKSSTCSLHIAFHGCSEFRPYTFKNFITCSGYLNIARMNKMIVLFPKASSEPLYVNGLEFANCWDFYGERGQEYGNKLSPQNQAIYKMVLRLFGNDDKKVTILAMDMNRNLVLLYGSQTGTAEDISERIAREGIKRQFQIHMYPMDDYAFQFLTGEKSNDVFCFVCSTTGQGDEPDNMKKFWLRIRRKNCPNLFSNVKFAVLGLGDSSYIKFNFIAKKLHKRILQLGGISILDVGLADDQHDLGPDAVIDPWLSKFWSTVSPVNLSNLNLNNDILHASKFLINNEQNNETNANHTVEELKEIPLELRALSAQKRVTSEDHFQDVRLISFDLKNSNLQYEPGDVLYVQPSNLNENVELFFNLFPKLKEMRYEKFHLEKNPLTPWSKIPQELLKIIPQPWTWDKCVQHYFDIQSIPRRYFFELLSHFTTSELEKEKLIEFCTPEGQQDLYAYCNRPKRNIIEVLQDFPHSTQNIPPEYLFDLIPPIKPRAFSIASSSRLNPNVVQILVAVVQFQTKLKKPRQGLCSNWLSRLNVGDLVPIWVGKGSFIFPSREKKTPVIFIGPGTGVAPFRSFICDRFDTEENIVLFFGCRYESKDHFFKNEWEKQQQRNDKIKIFTAFSRDRESEDKRRTYVQHKIRENGEYLWSLIDKENASIFLAGNAKRMPIDVNEALLDVFKSNGSSDPVNYLIQLAKTNRFQTEVWS